MKCLLLLLSSVECSRDGQCMSQLCFPLGAYPILRDISKDWGNGGGTHWQGRC